MFTRGYQGNILDLQGNFNKPRNFPVPVFFPPIIPGQGSKGSLFDLGPWSAVQTISNMWTQRGFMHKISEQEQLDDDQLWHPLVN